MKDVKNVNYYDYDKNDIAKSLQMAMSQNADPTVVKYLNDERKAKIAAGGEALGEYRDDSLTKAADDYVLSYNKTNVDKLHQARRDAQTEGLKQAHQAARSTYADAAASASADYANARRLYLADAAKKQIDTEGSLARLGLGRGINSKATSGFGESARAMLLSDAAEGLRELYTDEQKAKGALASDMQESMSAANEKYLENVDESYRDQASDTLSADKNHSDARLELLAINQKQKDSDRDFEYGKNQDTYNNAFDMFVKTGRVETPEQAQILGLEVGATTESFKRFEQEVLNDASTREMEERKQIFNEAFSLLGETGRVETPEQAAVLGLPVGTTTLDAEKLAYEISYSERKFASEEEQRKFENMYKMFGGVGIVTTPEQAEVLGVKVGTTYWQYITDKIRANASATNAAANIQGVAVDRIEADNDTYKNKTDRMKVENDIASDAAKRSESDE